MAERSEEEAPLLQEQTSRLQRKHYILILVIFTYMQGVGFSFFVVNEWIHHFIKSKMESVSNNSMLLGCVSSNHSDPDYKTHEKAQKETARWQMFVSLSLLPALLALAVLPSLSDKRGRKLLLTIGIAGTLWRQISMIFIIYFRLDLIYIVVVTLIESLSGASYSFNSAVFSYVADVTSPGRQRTVGITCTEGLVMLCNTFSSLIVGYCIRHLEFMTSSILAASLGVFAILITVIALPETLLTPETDFTDSFNSINSKYNNSNIDELTSSLELTVSFYRKTPQNSGFLRRQYALLLGAYFLTELSQNHRGAIELLYQLGSPLCWSAEKIGQFAMIRHALQGLVGPAILAPTRSCLSDLTLAMLSTVANCVSYVVEGFAKTDVVLYIAAVPVTFSFLTIPLLKSIMSTMTPSEKQGSLFAGMLLVQVVCSVINSFLLNSVYMATVSLFNGFVFLLLAAICIIALLIMICFACLRPKDHTRQHIRGTAAI